MKYTLVALLFLIPACFQAVPDVRKPASLALTLDPRFTIVEGFEREFSLTNEADRKILQERFQEMQKRLKADARPTESDQGKWPQYFTTNEELSNKKLKKSISFMLGLLEKIQVDGSPESSLEAVMQFQEMNRALLLNFVPPIEDHYTVSDAVKLAAQDLFSHPFLKGVKPAKEVNADLWENTGDLSQKNLKWGFNRSTSPLAADQICDYEEPKTGYGTRPGFTMKCDGKKIKVKFKEIHAEPFTTRIFWALGYHIEPVDYAPSVRIRYDRRIMDEFNSRKKIMIRVTLLGKNIVKKPFARTFDAMEFMDHLVLKNGKKIVHSEIPAFLLDENGEYRKDHESEVAEIVTVAAQIQESNDALVKVGPWSFNELDHMDKREMRALVVLAAWLNWYDVRFDNNRVALIDGPNGEPKLQLYIGDVGSAMGNVSKLIHFMNSKIERADLFSDRFTTIHRGEFKIKNYFRLIDENKAFNEATLEDARWIGRLMLKLKSEQIHDALVASGFSANEVEVFQEKLLKRLAFMKSDLGI